jgi:hypothetical protein
VTRPRAADDFDAIRARLAELRRERAQITAESPLRPAPGPRPYSVSARAALADKRHRSDAGDETAQRRERSSSCC